ncbi:MAG: hypothetical protein AAF409_20565 [Pseudomonadota bacterium]
MSGSKDKPEKLSKAELDAVQGGITLDNGIKRGITLDNGIKRGAIVDDKSLSDARDAVVGSKKKG